MPRSHRAITTLFTLCAAGASACLAAPAEDAPEGAREGLSLSSGTDLDPDPQFCLEPDPDTVGEDYTDLALPAPPPELGEFGLLEGLTVGFEPRRPVDHIVRRVELETGTSRIQPTSVTMRFGGWSVIVQTGRVYRREYGRQIYLSTGGRALREVELLVSYDFRAARDGTRGLSIGELSVVGAADGATADVYQPSLSLVDPPSDCREEAMIEFGPFAWGIPPVNVPTIVDCSTDRCKKITTAWLKLHHNIWRASQMFAVLEPMHPEQKSYFWDQPGTDANGDPVSLRSSPAYWFGPYDGDRYEAVREVVLEYFDNVLEADIGDTNLILRCPDFDHNPGNWCFTHQPIAHHVVKGKIDFCLGTWGEATCGDGVSDTVDKVMHHEPLHHVWTHLDGDNRMLKDSFTHQHGNACGIPLGVDVFYCEDVGNDGNEIRHLVTWQDSDTGTRCNHLDKVVRAVDAYANFVRVIGEMVSSGEMMHWPKLADATPVPPDCEGDIGCLCDDIGLFESPDGDYSASQYCPDNDGLAVCMKTTFNASDTVGICTRCSDFRGPGCPCNDVTMECDQGLCWGDDTNGTDTATGTCYDDPPPTWGCLADCEALLGAGAFCLPDHPDHARCVPVGTTLPEAHNCWIEGGHMDPNELACTYSHECITTQDCMELGYPPSHVCDASLRCVPDVW